MNRIGAPSKQAADHVHFLAATHASIPTASRGLYPDPERGGRNTTAVTLWRTSVLTNPLRPLNSPFYL